MKLADALLRRKQLQEKVDHVAKVKDVDIFETKVQRRSVTDSVDDIVARVPKMKLSQVTHEYDFYAKNLRLIDAAIQQTNWTTEIDVDKGVWLDYLDVHADKDI